MKKNKKTSKKISSDAAKVQKRLNTSKKPKKKQMAKKPKNNGKDWTKPDIHKLKNLAKGNTPTGLIAYKLGRTENSIRSKASLEKIPLKPTNKSPYDRKVSNKKKKK